MARKAKRIPKLGIHKATGQARAVFDGKHCYFGKPGPLAERLFRAKVREWLGEAGHEATDGSSEPLGEIEVRCVADLIAAFLEVHERYYVRADGSQTGELDNYRAVFAVLLETSAGISVGEFSPKRLKEVRQAMIDRGWSRCWINEQVRRIKHLFRWGVGDEHVDPEVWHGLRAVEGLKMFRTEAPEPKPKDPVPEEHIEAALPFMPTPVANMVRLQVATGMRPGEVIQMRMCDLDRTQTPWLYRPEQHKTRHCGRTRLVALGPEARRVLDAALRNLDPSAFLFSPTDSESERSASRRAARTTPMTPSQLARGRATKARDRDRPPGRSYTVSSYRRAVQRACDRAGVQRWSPGALRRNAAARFVREFGIEKARAVLGHADVRTTQIYSELDQAAAAAAAERIG